MLVCLIKVCLVCQYASILFLVLDNALDIDLSDVIMKGNPSRDRISTSNTKKPSSEKPKTNYNKKPALKTPEICSILQTRIGIADVYKFSPQLSSFQRMEVHREAELIGLSHESRGEGDCRHVIVWDERRTSSEQQKTEVLEEKVEPVAESVEDNLCDEDAAFECLPVVEDTDIEVSEVVTNGEKPESIFETGEPQEKSEGENEIVCSTCGAVVPKRNSLLHMVRCTKTERSTVTQEKVVDEQQVTKKKKSKRKAKKSEESPVQDDDDTLLANALAEKNTCGFSHSGGKPCKTSVATLGQVCRHCKKMFCLNHSLPEAHGCGEDAKKQAREEFRRPQGPPRGESSKAKAKRTVVHSELEKKLKNMADSRKKQTKKK